MDLKPRSKLDQTGRLFGQTFILWRATPLVGFFDKTAFELIRNLRLHLMNDLDYDVNDGTVVTSPAQPTIMDATLAALQLRDWEKVNESSQVLELVLTVWYPKLLKPSEKKLYFLPATMARQTGRTMIGAVDYPLLLARFGTGKLGLSIQRWLKNNFGCDITNFHVSGSMMATLVNWWTGSLNNIYDYELDGSNLKSKACLELTYYISFTKNLDNINFTISVDQLRKMQELIQGTDLNMMDLIKEHVYKGLRINMDYCILARVGTPVAYISNTSQLKLLKNGGSKSQYLDFLSELCDLAGTSY